MAKALEVDSAAKSAEKERKARSAEKRKDKSSSGSQEVTPTQLSSSSNSGGAAQSFHSTPEKLTPLSNNTSSSGCGGITNFVNSATTADLFASAARSAAVQLLALAPGNRLASLAQMDSSENYVNQQTPTSSSHQQQQPFNLVQSPTSFSAAISPGSQQRNNLNLSIGKANTIDSYSAATNCKTPSQIVTPSKDYSSIPLISLNLPPAPIGLPQPSSSLVAIKVENICPRPEP